MRINRKNYSPEQFPGVHGFLRWNAGECKGSIARKEREKKRGREERGGGDTEGEAINSEFRIYQQIDRSNHLSDRDQFISRDREAFKGTFPMW